MYFTDICLISRMFIFKETLLMPSPVLLHLLKQTYNTQIVLWCNSVLQGSTEMR